LLNNLLHYRKYQTETGAGATLDYARQWWYPFGIDYPNARERISLLDEGLEGLRLLWNKPEVHFNGNHFKITGARIKNPKTPISITVAAKQKKMMQNMLTYGNLPIFLLRSLLL